MDNILIPVEAMISSLKGQVRLLNMKKPCPHLCTFGDKIRCVYLEDHRCFNIVICPGNSDAWCTKMIERGLTQSKKKKPCCEVYADARCDACDLAKT